MSDARWTDMAAAWVLGALDADEARAFEARLEQDAELQAEVRAQREVLGMLADSAPRRTPPAALKERILAEARSTRPISSAPSASRSDDDVRSADDVQSSDGVGSDDDGRRGTPTAEPGDRTGAPGRTRSPILPFLAAAAAIAAVALGIGNRRLAERADALEEQLRAAEGRVDEAVDLIAERDSLLNAFLGPDVRSATLASTGAEPSARVFFNAATGGVVVTAFGLPPAPAGRTYQLWGIAEGADPVSLGTFQTGADGTAIVRSTAPVGAEFAISAVTEEPAGGSPQPTSTPFLVGSWGDD